MGNCNRICCQQFGRLVWLSASGELLPNRDAAVTFADMKTARAKAAELIARPDIDSVEVVISGE